MPPPRKPNTDRSPITDASKALKRARALAAQLQTFQQAITAQGIAAKDIAAVPGVDVRKVPIPRVVSDLRNTQGQQLFGQAQEGGWTKVAPLSRTAPQGVVGTVRHEAAHHVLWQQGVPADSAVEGSQVGGRHHQIIAAATIPTVPLNFNILRTTALATAGKPSSTRAVAQWQLDTYKKVAGAQASAPIPRKVPIRKSLTAGGSSPARKNLKRARAMFGTKGVGIAGIQAAASRVK